MPHRTVFHPAAEKELVDLYDYIADQSGTSRAWNFVDEIRRYCLSMAEFPQRGARHDEIRPGLRVVGYKRVVSIAFQVTADELIILGIFYRGRNITREAIEIR